MTVRPLLQVDNLSVEFHQRRRVLHALDGISFSVKAGEILGFVGESGAGKSLTGSAIMGLIEPPGRITNGEIYFNDTRIDHSPEMVRGRHIGMIFQDPLTSLNPLKTIGDQLVETIMVNLHESVAEANARARNLLEKVGIDSERLSAFPHEFSGGMRQRIVIALALAAEPKLIIADEPTTALDVSIQNQILTLLVGLCKSEGAAMLLITHDMGVIAQNTDRVAVLYAGRMIELGDTKMVVNKPRHPYTKGLMRASPNIDHVKVNSTLEQINGHMPSLDALPGGCRFNPRCQDVMEICKRQTPDFIENVACHLYGERPRKKT
jgi:peptide/nickel transport system ATP-binding protein